MFTYFAGKGSSGSPQISPFVSLRSESTPPVSALRISALRALSERSVFLENDKEFSAKPAFYLEFATQTRL